MLFMKWSKRFFRYLDSVANAAVHLPKLGYFEIAWSRSKNYWAGGIKLDYFSSVCPQQLFSSLTLSVSCQFKRVFEHFQCPRTFFSSISGVKMSWRAINIDYPPHPEVKNLIVFHQIGWLWLFCGWKAPKFGKLGTELLDKNWATLKSLAVGKKAGLLQFGALKFNWQHCI